MIRCLIILLLLPLGGIAQTRKTEKFVLTGNLTGFTEGTMFYLVSLGKEKFSDSASVKKGKVIFEGEINEPTVFRITTKAWQYRAVWIESGHITLTGDISNFSNSTVTNSKVNTQAKVIDDMLNPLYAKSEALYANAEKEKNDEVKKRLWASAAVMDDSTKVLRIRNVFSLAPSYPLMQELYFLRSSMPKDSIRLALERFPESIRKSGNGKALTDFAATKSITVGMKAPDITGKNINGDIVRLSSLQGKLVLLDFWAGWCGPCRRSNKQLVTLYRDYKAKGFEIFSFNIDTKFEEWNKATTADGINWVNVSDLSGTYSPSAIAYNIQGIPKAFLIDKDGVIREIINGYSEKNHDLILKYINAL